MKKIIFATVAVIVIIIVICIAISLFILSNTAKLEGKYTNVDIGTGGVLEFDGKNVTVTYMSAGTEVYRVSGTYKIENGNIIMNFDNENIQGVNVFEGSHAFDTGEDHVIIDGVIYKRAE